MSNLPGWNSAATVSRIHAWFEIAGIICLALLVFTEVVAYVYGHRKDTLQQIENERHTGSAHAMLNAAVSSAARANELVESERTERLKLAQESAPRSITAEQRNQLLERLRGLGSVDILILATRADKEVTTFADAIGAALRDAGCNIERESAIGATTYEDLVVRVTAGVSEKIKISAQALVLAMRAVGISVNLGAEIPHAHRSPITVLVGEKSRASSSSTDFSPLLPPPQTPPATAPSS
jgi:hypothetical protein